MCKLIIFNNALTHKAVFINPAFVTHVFSDVTYNEQSREVPCVSICLSNSLFLKVKETLTIVLKKLEEKE